MKHLIFRRYGGSIQLWMKSFDELVQAMDVAEALWVATACPTQGLSCDPKFLEYLDRDANKRVRVDEVRAAVRWTRAKLRDVTGCDEGSDTLQLDHLSDEATPLREAAALVLGVLDAPRTSISLGQVRSSEQALRKAGYNGDGIIAPEQLTRPELATLATLILRALPGATNLAGLRGVDAATLTAFREGRERGLKRLERRAEVMAWGEATMERAEQLRALAPRLDEYFLQGRLVAAQPEASPLLRLTDERVIGALGDREALSRAALALPIARPSERGELRWSELLHGPSYEALMALRRDVFAPLSVAPDTLTEADYRATLARAEQALAWRDEAASDPVVALGDELTAIEPGWLDALAEASAEDLAKKPHLDALKELEQLLLYQRWLLTFANNFVAMPDLYSLRRSALFERGRLVLGGRLFTLAVQVPDRAAHSALAATNTMCLAYLKLERNGIPEPLEVVVPVTSGTSAGITVGKRGIFYDTDEHEYDATITQVVLHPVSLWEAMTQPFTRIAHFVASRVQSFGESGDKTMASGLARAGNIPAAPAPAPPAPPPAAAPAAPAANPLGGAVAAGGLAFAAVGSAIAFIINQLKSITVVDLLRAAIAIVLIIMIPAGVLGWLKLRKRNLAILLEGSGWALNDRLLLTRPLGMLFTRRPARPKGARVDYTAELPILRSSEDEEEVSTVRPLLLLLAIGVALTLAWEARAPIAQGVRWLLPPPSASAPAPPAPSP